MSSLTDEALIRAADTLEALALGATLERCTALEAALTLRTYADLLRDMDLLEAVERLETMATGGRQPDVHDRHRAAVLAKRVRAEASG